MARRQSRAPSRDSRLIEAPAAAVSEMIDALDACWPGTRDPLCDSRPGTGRHISAFAEGRRATLETRLARGAEVTVLTAISRGLTGRRLAAPAGRPTACCRITTSNIARHGEAILRA